MRRPSAIAFRLAVRRAASSRDRTLLVTAVVALAISLMMVTSGCSLGIGHKSNAQLLEQAASYTRCMRAHGLPSFPEPTLINGSVNLNTPASLERMPSYPVAAKACKSRLPG